jgi:hypothetical protein
MIRRALLLLLSAFAVLAFAGSATADGGSTLFVRSAVENGNDSVTLPLYTGLSAGRTVKFVVLDASTGEAADAWRVNRSTKLANARNTPAVQKVTFTGGTIQFPGTVNFAPAHVVVPGPTGFPPADFAAGSVADDAYSPLIQLPDGTILNAPQVANATGLHDKVVAIGSDWVTLKQTRGFQGGRAVKYVSTDASVELAAALEGATLAPRLNAAPSAGDDSTQSSRASLALFVNGQTGAANPQRQGVTSALLDGLDPLNVLFWNPSQGRYSPLWDVFPTVWTPAGDNLRQDDFGDVINLAQHGLVTGLGGGAWSAAGIVVDCPIISREG